jgi:hypothetical protein
MKTPIYLFLCLAIVACNANPKGNQRDSTKSDAIKPSYSGPFDLGRLKLNENLPELMAGHGIKTEPKAESDKTLLGYEIFKSSNPKALSFGNKDLSGTYGKNKNYVLFDYSEDKKTLAFYELMLYNQAQTDTLINLLGKVGTIIFKQTKLPKGSLDLDKNGNAIPFPAGTRKTFRVWENKSTGLSYFLIETGSGQNLITKLIVLKRSQQPGKDWVSYLSLDWYKDFKSEPL